MIKLNVWLDLNKETKIRAGELIAADPDFRGAVRGQFRYTQEYLDWPEAFPLDPIHLPLSRELFDAERPRSGIHGVFEDSLPDDWGRRLLVKKYKLARKDQRPPHFLRCLAGDGLGALRYSESNSPPEKQRIPRRKHLKDLQRQANLFEEDAFAADDDFALLFQAGSSPGGARPKVLIQDKERAYLAKFASLGDRFDVVSLEAAAMELAGRCGIEAAPTKCIPCGNKKTLLVERFDIDFLTGRRNHVISMQTLLGADGYYRLGYKDMSDIIRRISTEPARDLEKLFKQMVFNALIGNTDDHLKNFSMIYDINSWRLSPAYDLVPNIGQNSEHVLSIYLSTRVPDRTALMQEAKSFGIKRREQADEIITYLVSQIESWEEIFRQFNVPSRDIEIIGRDIDARLTKIQT